MTEQTGSGSGAGSGSGSGAAVLVAVCVVSTLHPDAGQFGVTAIDKRAVVGPVKVTKFGVRGDVQADRKFHGGLDQALYAYSQDDADFWSKELGRELHPGWFGENLRIDGLDVNAARIGERWQIGEKLEVEVTLPREPCQTFARWVGGANERGWVKRFSIEGRIGPYLRVIHTGSIAAGDPVVVTHVPDDAPTVLEAYRGVSS
jgi:MOSC domain-containing protein YiiM